MRVCVHRRHSRGELAHRAVPNFSGRERGAIIWAAARSEALLDGPGVGAALHMWELSILGGGGVSFMENEKRDGGNAEGGSYEGVRARQGRSDSYLGSGV